MMNDLWIRFSAMLISVLSGWLVQHFGHLGIDQNTANVVSAAIVAGGCGWATKFYTDWNKKTVPVDAVVTPAKVELPQPKPPQNVG